MGVDTSEQKEHEEYVQEHILTDIINMPSPPRKVKVGVTEATSHIKKRLISSERQVEKLKRKLKTKVFPLPRNINAMPVLPRSIVRMQLYHKKRTPWLSDEKSAALSIFHKSPSTYKYLRSKGVVLPLPSAISKWLKNYDCRPGIRQNFLTLQYSSF